VAKLILGRYTRQGLWTLFLMCALPLHIWTLILAFRDLPWLTDRTNAWDAFGVMSYGLIFALVESILLFLAFALLGTLVPKSWEPGRRVNLLSALALILSLWAMISQLFFLAGVHVPDGIIAFLVRSPHPLWIIYGALLALTGISFLLPAWSALKQGSGLRVIGSAVERLGLLAVLYLIFDAAALVIVVIRNL
jgi:hypothetical protein